MLIAVHPHRLITALVVAALAAGVACPAAAQVYKCVDRAGRVTYQQQPCPDTHTGGRVALSVDNGRTQSGDESTDDWAERAKRKEVVPGMPRAFVVVAYGTPQEMRAGRIRENAAEVWSYRRSDFEIDVGFNGGVVAWRNDNPGASPAPAPNPDSPRQALGVGVSCESLAANLGEPTTTAEEFDEGLTRKVIRHRWEPTPTEPEHLVITCADGKIARLERTPAAPTQ